MKRKGLSVIQPWAWAMFYAGKDVENRQWKDTNPALHTARHLVRSGVRFIIHASIRMPEEEFDDCFTMVDDIRKDVTGDVRLRWRGAVVNKTVDGAGRGGIVGSARMVGILKYHDDGPGAYSVVECGRYDVDKEAARKACRSPWLGYCSYAFVIADAKPCKFIQMRGGRGFFDVPPMLAGSALA